MMYDDPINRLLDIGLEAGDKRHSENPFRGFTLKTNIILFGVFTGGLRLIASVHDQYRKAKVADNLLVTAMPGCAKTTLLRYYAAAFPRYETDEGTVIPVLYVSAPDQPTLGDFASEALKCLGDPFPTRGNVGVRKKRVIELLKQCRVELFLIDEFNHFYHGRRKSESLKIPDWIKVISNETGIPIVVAGLPISVLVIEQVENIQLKRRFKSPYHLDPFSIDEKKVAHLRELIARMVNLLPLPCKISTDERFIKSIFFASNGSIDYIVKLFDGAVKIAGESDAKTLELVHFKKSFRAVIWNDCPTFLNPFNPESIFRPLVGFGEPFFGWTSPIDYRPAFHKEFGNEPAKAPEEKIKKNTKKPAEMETAN